MGGRVALLLIRDQRIERSLNPVGRGFFRRRFGDDLQHRRSGRMQAQHHAPSSEDLDNQGAALYVALERKRVKDLLQFVEPVQLERKGVSDRLVC
jgi:hypothetical protein